MNGNAVVRHLKFWSAWLRDPRQVGALVPSSPALARAMADAIPTAAPGMVVELGGGTGAISRAILERIPPEHLAIVERDPELANLLARRFPGVRVIHGDATRLSEWLAAAGIDRVCCVISALPLLSLPDADRAAVIAAIRRVLPPGGRLVQFTYGFGNPLKTVPGEIGRWCARRLKWVLFNLPPAFVWCYEALPPDSEPR